uniref:Uncharacterized protein n=1 Tax=Opuntia streptacantha TaxID=393608 RepID=A0A7C9DYX9_OPUST
MITPVFRIGLGILGLRLRSRSSMGLPLAFRRGFSTLFRRCRNRPFFCPRRSQRRRLVVRLVNSFGRLVTTRVLRVGIGTRIQVEWNMSGSTPSFCTLMLRVISGPLELLRNYWTTHWMRYAMELLMST